MNFFLTFLFVGSSSYMYHESLYPKTGTQQARSKHLQYTSPDSDSLLERGLVFLQLILTSSCFWPHFCCFNPVIVYISEAIMYINERSQSTIQQSKSILSKMPKNTSKRAKSTSQGTKSTSISSR